MKCFFLLFTIVSNIRQLNEYQFDDILIASFGVLFSLLPCWTFKLFLWKWIVHNLCVCFIILCTFCKFSRRMSSTRIISEFHPLKGYVFSFLLRQFPDLGFYPIHRRIHKRNSMNEKKKSNMKKNVEKNIRWKMKTGISIEFQINKLLKNSFFSFILTILEMAKREKVRTKINDQVFFCMHSHYILWMNSKWRES